MKTTIAIIGVCVIFCGHALSQTNQLSFPNGILTLSGERYEEVKVEEVFTNELRIIYFKPNGAIDMVTINIDDLPPDWKKFCKSYKAKPRYVFPKTNQIIVPSPTVSLKLSNSVLLQIVKIDSADPDGINVAYLHKSQAGSQIGYVDHVKIPFEFLSEDIQKRYHYDPIAADAYKKMLEANAEAQRKVEKENEKIAAQEAEQQKEERDLEIKIAALQALQAQAIAQQRQADAAERAADAQERAANAQENQSLSQQQIANQLEDLNWQLMRLRQNRRIYY